MTIAALEAAKNVEYGEWGWSADGMLHRTGRPGQWVYRELSAPYDWSTSVFLGYGTDEFVRPDAARADKAIKRAFRAHCAPRRDGRCLVWYVILAAVSLLALTTCAAAQAADCYADVGLMVHSSNDSWQDVAETRQGPDAIKIINPIGVIETGCTLKRATIFLYHSTSMQMKDTGINGLGVKYRIWRTK